MEAKAAMVWRRVGVVVAAVAAAAAEEVGAA
jgi:hypothetical protein